MIKDDTIQQIRRDNELSIQAAKDGNGAIYRRLQDVTAAYDMLNAQNERLKAAIIAKDNLIYDLRCNSDLTRIKAAVQKLVVDIESL